MLSLGPVHPRQQSARNTTAVAHCGHVVETNLASGTLRAVLAGGCVGVVVSQPHSPLQEWNGLAELSLREEGDVALRGVNQAEQQQIRQRLLSDETILPLVQNTQW